ncbi:short-chain dehydrogenase [Rhodococcus ruber]|uniref:SDR family NAD(P)-dependent oxidoreductase n=1 Tax=Rhodococcus TaxID=1827 RepID=UPI00029AE47B|nr:MULTISPECIES: SDR family NAD(P)-dependent oxidoreductase [Rhodococcus]ATQ30214.1 short-chain dehydrogenase [Rhodococcus ruber]
MSKVAAIFGAGTGLGLSVARRFGREGFRVALVARRKDRLDALVAQLADEGIEATPFAADLTVYEDIADSVQAIRDHFGRLDVVEYGPVSGDLKFSPATELDAAAVQELTPLLLLTPVEIVRAVLPEMIERGDGAILLTLGYSALEPMPYMSGVGPVMAAARNYWYSLHGELAGTGVYAGTLTVGAIIERSELGEAATAQAQIADTSSPATFPNGVEITTVDPDELAAIYWDMYTARDGVERVYPRELTP